MSSLLRRSKSAFHLGRLLSTVTTAEEVGGGSIWGHIFLCLPPTFAFGLGVWQIKRKSWKEDLLQERLGRIQASSVDVFSNLTTIPTYSRVQARGLLLEDKSVFIGPRPRTINGTQQKGYVLITPMIDPNSQQMVLVNRGWVPESWRKQAQIGTETAMQSVSKDQKVQIECLVVESENPSIFVPKNDPKSGDWFWIDRLAIAQSAGLPLETLLIQVIDQTAGHKPPPQIHGARGRTIEFNANEQYPVSKHISDFSNFTVMPDLFDAVDHKNYALIWFSLSLAMFWMAFRVTRGKRRRQ